MSFDRISRDPKVVSGKPCVKGTRLTVARVLYVLAAYPDRAELRENFPSLDDEAIKQALEYAAAAVEDRIIDLAVSA